MNYPEVLFGSKDSKRSNQLSAAVKQGKLRKIAPRLYTSNMLEAPEVIVRRNLFTVLGGLYPGSVLSHRSAFEFAPTDDRKVFVTTTYTRKISLLDLTIHFITGPGPDSNDQQIAPGLFVAHDARAFLENLTSVRNVGGTVRILDVEQIEDKLDQIVRIHGEEALNELRDRAREYAQSHELEREFALLTRKVSALLATRPSTLLQSASARARSEGLPYDPQRIALFEVLFQALNQQEFAVIPSTLSPTSARHFAFYEAYFSNFIEGTTFEVAEAKAIIDRQEPLPMRAEDSHEILGTYRIVHDAQDRVRTPHDLESIQELLKTRHAQVLFSRPQANPGLFKSKSNRAGNTVFVDPELVRGTLAKSLGFYRILRHPFARAAYMMFVVSEVHPFTDGNGRIARIMMNAELSVAEQQRIIIPTVFRPDYLLTLKRLSSKGDPLPYLKMLQRAQLFSAMLNFEEFEQFTAFLERSNAFAEDDERVLRF
jgi:hypothetical protein